MKQGWEIKKLGEVCKIQTGKLDANAKEDDGMYPFFTCDAKPYRINTFAFDDEAILISGNGSLVGHVNYYNGKFNAYQRTYVLTKFTSYHLPFLISYLKGFLRSYIIENKKGGCIPYITLPILQNFTIPCPTIAEQEKIVAELDCLSGIIEKKKQQLKELDNLAQSIFYEMFGDPVENDKGWERLLFEKCIEKVRYTAKIATCNYATTGTFPIISQEEDYISGYWNNAEDVFMISKPVVIFGDHTRVLKYVDFDFVLGADGVKILQPIDTINAKFFLYYLIASKIPSLGYSRHYKLLKELKVLLPPLSLQQDFASKIESIEKQKELIAQSIKETETLFNSRMDYYFN